MADKVKYWSDGVEHEIDRERCVFTDRTRIVDRKNCGHLWWHRYHGGPAHRGVVSSFESEDLVTGRAVHAGLEAMLGPWNGMFSDRIESAAVLACEQVMEVFERGELLIQGDSSLATVAPELARMLAEEQAWLAYALVWAFGRRRLETLLEEYEVVAREEEIAWKLGGIGGETYEDKAVIMLSRLDGIVRRKSDGRLLVLEHKTSKELDRDKLEDITIDEQGAAQMLAVAERYGEMPAGVLYNFLLKGEKWREKEIGLKRYRSYLVRPYCNWTGPGEPTEFNFSPEYEFEKGDGSKGRLGKGWARVDIWGEGQIGVREWLEMLDSGLVKPELERDWLGEVVVQPEIVEWTAERLDRWRAGALYEEQRHAWYQASPEDTEAYWMHEIMQRAGACRTFRQRCSYWDVCWNGETLVQLMVGGRMAERVANHPGEFAEEEVSE